MASGVSAADATAAPTIAVTPAVVRNGGSVTVTGTAPCSAVEIDAHPGALGVRSIRPITAQVSEGRFSVRVHLPVFTADVSRPGLYDQEGFIANCPGIASDTSELLVTGIELPRTGSDTHALVVLGVAAIFCGLAGLVLTRTRRLGSLGGPSTVP